MRVADLMTRNVVTVGIGTGVRHAADLMLKHRVSGLPVIDDAGSLVGLVTEGDLLRRAELGLPGLSAHPWQSAVSPAGVTRDFVKRHSWRISDVMTSAVVTTSESATIAEVAELMDTRGIKRLPVLREGALVGVISRADLLHCIADERRTGIAHGDDAIRVSIAARLREAAAVLGNAVPTVTVRDGVVHLWGAIQSEECSDAIRVIVESVPGTNGIEDHSVILPLGSETPSAPPLSPNAPRAG